MTNRRQTSCVSKTLRRHINGESLKAIWVYPFGFYDPQHRPEICLPKSVIAVVDEIERRYWEIIIPGWLVRRHNLADAPFEEPEETYPFFDDHIGPDGKLIDWWLRTVFWTPQQLRESVASLEAFDKCSREAQEYRRTHPIEVADWAKRAADMVKIIEPKQPEPKPKPEIDLPF